MIKVEDLTGISEAKREEVVECLEDLLTFKDPQGKLSPVISGYNLYTTIPKFDSVIAFSNIHETEAYKSAMLKDFEKFGYDPQTILEQIRDKAGAFLWNPIYRIRNDEGGILAGLKIKDTRTGKYINLEDYIEPLSEYPQFTDRKGYLIAEDQGWELDVPFHNKRELMKLVNIFLRKSGMYVYDEKGIIIPETNEERALRAPWSDAYRIPVLVLGESALSYADELPHFDKATKTSLIESNNEISFIIHKNLDLLRTLPHYEHLKRLGFNEEVCLGNKPFLRDIDKIR